MRALADSSAFWFMVAVVVLPTVYLLPTIIGVTRRVDNLPLVFLVNLIGAPSGIGWLAALILAFGPRRIPKRPAALWPPPSR